MERIEKEVDIFPTVYEKDFRWFKNSVPPKPYKDIDAYELTPEQKEKYLMIHKMGFGPEERRKRIKEFHIERLRTVYTVTYCKPYHPRLRPEMEISLEGGMILEVASKLYGPKTDQVLPPVPTSRRVMGFASMEDYYGGRSEYQEGVSRTGYILTKEALENSNETTDYVVLPAGTPLPTLPPIDISHLSDDEKRKIWR